MKLNVIKEEVNIYMIRLPGLLKKNEARYPNTQSTPVECVFS